MANIGEERRYLKPDEDRVVMLFKEGKTFYSIMEDQQCTVEALFKTLQKAWQDGKIR